MQTSPLSFDSPTTLVVAFVVAAIGIVIARYRRPALPVAARVLGAAGILVLAVAAGGPGWRAAEGDEVVVMVDVSPSTRVARYRDVEALRARVRQLVGDAPYRIEYFPGAAAATGGRLADVATERTQLAPPAAAAVLLFSDTQFELPAAGPPTHVVVDPGLDDVSDAAVERMELIEGGLVVGARNGGPPRVVSVTGPTTTANLTVPTGGAALAAPSAGSTGLVTARLAPGDPWPENDALSLALPPPEDVQRWWVGGRDAGGGWRSVARGELPSDPAAYLAPSVIVLDNVAAGELTDAQQRRLAEYVRDLGGGLVILGGDRAYAAGAYVGTRLDALSPLASHPPQPTAHWVFLVDSSGSMNVAADRGGSRWIAAVNAVAATVPGLPATDFLSVGGFAANVEWWLRSKAAGEFGPDAFPPAGSRPSGPTELRHALEQAVGAAAEGAPASEGRRVEIVVVTDANAPLQAPDALAEAMRAAGARLHLLDIGESSASGLAALREVVETTGGTLLRETDTGAWAASVQRIARAALPDRLVRAAAPVTFLGALKDLPPRPAGPPWNRTWLKPRAELVAEATAAGAPVAAGATWAAGEGRVLALGFGSGPADSASWLNVVERRPRDARFRVTWEAGSPLVVRVDATDAGGSGGAAPLNGLELTLELAEPGGLQRPAVPIPQVAPGRYTVAAAAPPASVFARVRLGGQVVDRAAVAGRYALEFDRIGNDRRAMRELATRTGGSVVEPSDQRRLPPPPPGHPHPLTPWAAVAGAALVAGALLNWRRGTA